MKKTISIIERQLIDVVNSWDRAVESYEDNLSYWRDADAHVIQLKKEKRFIASFQSVPWAKLIQPDTLALDVGCGSGWLSALLSRNKNIKQIYALDTSRSNLELLPQVVKILEGEITKIHPVMGLFDGLDILERKFDLIVSSAAIHHSTDIRKTLRGLHNALNKGGTLVVLNELPSSSVRYAYRIIIGAIKALRDLTIKHFPEETPMFSSSGILYNRKLGDWTYCLEQWMNFLSGVGFSVEIIPLNYSHKDQDSKGWRRENFVNFICHKP